MSRVLPVSCLLPPHWASYEAVERELSAKWTSRGKPNRQFFAWGYPIGDAPVLPDLLSQIPAGEEIGSVTADGAYDTSKCHDAIADRGAHAVIPPRKNAKPWKTVTAGAVASNEALRAAKYLGRTIWRNWSGYHRRSRVETKMHCVKLLGQRLMARDFDRQVAEVQIRIAVMNRYTALGIPVTEAVA